MIGAAIVPGDEFARRPTILLENFGSFGRIEEAQQKLPAVIISTVDDPACQWPVDVQRSEAGFFVADKDQVPKKLKKTMPQST